MDNEKQKMHALVRFEQGLKPRAGWLLLGILIFLALGYLIAHVQYAQLEQEDKMTELVLQQAQAKNQALENEVSRLKTAKILERETQLEGRSLMAQQQQEIDNLKTELFFYRNIMAPEKSADGVMIHDFVLNKMVDSSRFRYRLVLNQQKTRKRFARGQVTLTLHGSEDGGSKSYSHDQLGETNQDINFSFRYFQQLEGTLILPDGFVPEMVTVRVHLPASQNQKSSSTESSYEFDLLVSLPAHTI